MKWAVVALNQHAITQGQQLKKSCETLTDGIDIFTIEKYMCEGLMKVKGRLKAFNESLFQDYQVIVYVMAIGIVVRDIAPWIKHKSLDPAVLCMTVNGQYIIPVLSGHIGGANAVAEAIARVTGAVPVITTASDLLGKPAVDMMAKEKNLLIASFEKAKNITAMLIDEAYVQVYSDMQLDGTLGKLPIGHHMDADAKGLIYVGYKTKKFKVPSVQLIPKSLVLGIGARRDTPYEQIKDLLDRLLKDKNIDQRSIKSIASIDLKKDEQGIIQLAEGLNIPFITYSADELGANEGLFETSEFVKSTTGVGAVAMPSGYMASDKGTCVIEKVAEKGITMCLWEERNDLYR